MKHKLLLILSMVLFAGGCYAQTPGKEVYNDMFKWRIKIPNEFVNMTAEEYAANQKKGADALEQTVNSKIENHSKPIFVFKSDQLHYLESNYQPYDVKTDGDYSASCRIVNEAVYDTFKKQMNGAQIDSVYTSETIDGLTFKVFKISINFPNKMVLTCYMFSRLFTNRDFSVMLMYADKVKGEAMLNAFRKSTFGKK